MKSIIKKWKEYDTVNLPKADHLHKLSNSARRRLVREATKTPMTTLKELELGYNNCCPGSSPVKVLWGRQLIKSGLESTQRYVGDSKVKYKRILWSDETNIFWPSD